MALSRSAWRTARREHHLLEGAVHCFLHRRCAEDLGRLVEELVVDVHQAFRHEESISIELPLGYMHSISAVDIENLAFIERGEDGLTPHHDDPRVLNASSQG